MISKIMQEYMAYSYQPNFWTKLKKMISPDNFPQSGVYD